MAEAPAPPSRNILHTTAERMIYSAYNYWLVLVSDVAGAVGLLIFGIRHRSGSTTAAGVSVIGGFIAWGFLEYVVHRWLLHGRPSMARRGHARHHADATTLISTPALVVMAAACALWATLSMVSPTDVACLPNSRRRCGAFVSQDKSRPSTPPLTNVFPSGAKDTEPTS